MAPPGLNSPLYGSIDNVAYNNNSSSTTTKKERPLILHSDKSKSYEFDDSSDEERLLNMTNQEEKPLLSTSSSKDSPVSTYTTSLTDVCDTNGKDNGDKIIEVESDDSSSDDTERERRRKQRVLVKTQSSFWEDSYYFKDGSIPHSVVLALTIGIVCGTAAYLYYTVLFWLLEFVWHTLPEQILVVPYWPEWSYVLYIPLVGFTMAIGVGLTVVYLGEPGDLPYTIKCVHDKAYVAMSHVMPMVCASQFSIIGGGSLGPEAPLVAICASLGGFISRSIFHQTNRNLVRKHTLMGMAGALAAFFGCPLVSKFVHWFGCLDSLACLFYI